jgi:prophage DNA circulation protein
LDEASAIIAQAQDLIDAAGTKLAGYGAPLNDFIRKGLALKADILTLAASPLSLATSITGTIQGLRDLASTPEAALSVLSSLMDFGRDVKPVTGATPARLAQAQNQAAIIDIVTQSAASEAVKAVTEIEFASYNEAISARDDLADRLDDLALVAGDAGFDLVWQALSEARLAIVRDINFRAGDLAKIITYTPPATMPAILIAHALYGSDDIEAREDDIIMRNGITNPNFVVGGTGIEVLNA